VLGDGDGDGVVRVGVEKPGGDTHQEDVPGPDCAKDTIKGRAVGHDRLPP
jgi:hypothetical protein